MDGPDMFFLGALCLFVGILSGWMFAYSFLEPKYEKLLDETIEIEETRCLKTVRENYAKEQSTRKLLLHELGEALDVDVVALPSFGYITLKQAFEIPEDIVESAIGYDIPKSDDA